VGEYTPPGLERADPHSGAGETSAAGRYDAFMSYSHAADNLLAPALHAFAKPWNRRRALHVFRDKTSLAVSPELWPMIETALSTWRYFLLLASPESARSHWCSTRLIGG
jgi:hypothetical protein